MARRKKESTPVSMEGASAPSDAPDFADGAPVGELLGAAPESGPSDPDAAREVANTAAAVIDAAGAPEEAARGADNFDIGSTEPAKRGSGRRGGRPKGSGGRAYQTRKELVARVEQLEGQVAAAQPSAQEAEEMVAAALDTSFQVVFDGLSHYRGEHWKLAADQSRLLSAAWAPILAPYLADSPQAVKWAAALGVTWGVFMPRFREDARLAKLANAENTPAEVTQS